MVVPELVVKAIKSVQSAVKKGSYNDWVTMSVVDRPAGPSLVVSHVWFQGEVRFEIPLEEEPARDMSGSHRLQCSTLEEALRVVKANDVPAADGGGHMEMSASEDQVLLQSARSKIKLQKLVAAEYKSQNWADLDLATGVDIPAGELAAIMKLALVFGGSGDGNEEMDFLLWDDNGIMKTDGEMCGFIDRRYALPHPNMAVWLNPKYPAAFLAVIPSADVVEFVYDYEAVKFEYEGPDLTARLYLRTGNLNYRELHKLFGAVESTDCIAVDGDEVQTRVSQIAGVSESEVVELSWSRSTLEDSPLLYVKAGGQLGGPSSADAVATLDLLPDNVAGSQWRRAVQAKVFAKALKVFHKMGEVKICVVADRRHPALGIMLPSGKLEAFVKYLG